ncbi:aminotriazole resistance protein [Colletotrichum truncatum]|uniref:Aminotriazole resistance protein n=1 Tax=Colletotrichum truncatum TaxID=5467 RepID=A0ACC3Z5Y5_COLTU|nr:aminotriazole resistance protein [Colletotrichum truncatum]KAF6787262.1 aminotriazole resistance protein [Colletotrichum truncatum]
MTSSSTSRSIDVPKTAWETRSATEAMQSVADIMISVTESFRKQFREPQDVSNMHLKLNGRENTGWRAPAPVLVSHVANGDNELHRTQTSPPRPGTASSVLNPPSCDLTISSVLFENSGPFLIDQNPTAKIQRCFGSLESHSSSFEHVNSCSNIACCSGSCGILPPEPRATSSQYPYVFEAAQKIVISQRGRGLVDTSPMLNREHLSPATTAQTTTLEEQTRWTRQTPSCQAQFPFRQIPTNTLSSTKEVSLVAVISLHQILMFAGLSQAMAPALVIARSFINLPAGQHSWFTAAYALNLGVFTLPSARIGDVFGHRHVIVFGCFWFGLWCLLAGFSLKVQDGGCNGAIYFCICRAMQGIGSALCVPNGLSILESALPPGERKDVALSLFSAAAPFGFVIGAVMASFFAIHKVWYWSFFALSAVCIAAAALSALVLPRQQCRRLYSNNTPWVNLDVSGIGLSATGLALFCFAWNQAPAVGWRTPYIYFLLIIGLLFLLAFLHNETLVDNPLLPIRAMNSATALILACTAAGWGSFVIWVFYSFQFAEVLRDWDPLFTSASFVPLAIEGFVVVLLLAYLMPDMEIYWAFLGSLVALLLASILTSTAPADQVYWANKFVSTLLAPLGMVMLSPLATTLLSNNLAEGYQAVSGKLVLAVTGFTLSLNLGMARSIEVQVNNDGQNILSGYRGAQYYGLGLGGLGVILALALSIRRSAHRRERLAC